MNLSAGIADCADLRIVPTVTRYAFRSGRFLRATSAQASPGVSENSRSSRKPNRSAAGLPVVDRRLRPGEYGAGFGQVNITAESIDIGVDRVVRPQRNPRVVVAGGDRPCVGAKATASTAAVWSVSGGPSCRWLAPKAQGVIFDDKLRQDR